MSPTDWRFCMNKRVPRIVPLLLIGLCLSVPFLVIAQDDGDDSKSIKAERFMKARRADKSRSSATYRRAKPTNAGASVRPKGIDVAEVGITIWRFRRSQAADKTK